MYLDTINPKIQSVGYGEIGRGGQLGYADGYVKVRDVPYGRCISAHTPSRITYDLDGTFESFSCHVALNDTAGDRIWVEFHLYADGDLVAAAPRVTKHEPPRELFANIHGTKTLELVVQTDAWEHATAYSHPVWIDPVLSKQPITELVAPFGRATFAVPADLVACEKVILTIITPNYADLLDDMLSSLYANGQVQDATLAVFGFDLDEKSRAILAKYNAYYVECNGLGGQGLALKAAVFSIAHVIRAKKYLFLDADTLILGDMRPLFDNLDVLCDGGVLIGRELPRPDTETLGSGLLGWYHATEEDMKRLRVTPSEREYPLLINSGVWSGTRKALLGADNLLRALMPFTSYWENEKKPTVWWREQGLWNLALARLGCAFEMDPTFNCQLLYNYNLTVDVENGKVDALWHNRPVKVLHLNGPSKDYVPQARGRWLNIPNPRFGQVPREPFETFRNTLDAWRALDPNLMSQSFYPQVDMAQQTVKNAIYSGYQMLFNVTQEANARQILDLSSHRGITTALFACSTSPYTDGSVLAINAGADPEAQRLWNMLPGYVRRVIGTRDGDLLITLKQLTRDHEGGFDAAFMDTQGLEAPVFTAFLLASRLVRAEQPLFLHEYAEGCDFDALLGRIRQEGYSITVHSCEDVLDGARQQTRLAVIRNARGVV